MKELKKKTSALDYLFGETPLLEFLSIQCVPKFAKGLLELILKMYLVVFFFFSEWRVRIV